MKRLFLLMIFSAPFFVLAQLSGRVINERKEGIPFASVSIKNGSAGISTDSAGQFSIAAPGKYPFTLIVTSVGYRQREVMIKDDPAGNLTIVLEALYRQDTVIITSRRRREVLQDVPIPISVTGGGQIDDAGSFNVTRR